NLLIKEVIMASFRTVHSADGRFPFQDRDCIVCLSPLKDMKYVVLHNLVEDQEHRLKATCKGFYHLVCFFQSYNSQHGKKCGNCRITLTTCCWSSEIS